MTRATRRKIRRIRDNVLATLVIVLLLGTVALANSWANHYTIKGECSGVEANGLCLITDARGEGWEVVDHLLQRVFGEVTPQGGYIQALQDILLLEQ